MSGEDTSKTLEQYLNDNKISANDIAAVCPSLSLVKKMKSGKELLENVYEVLKELGLDARGFFNLHT
eukprot:32317-Rhodomonas_salina.1